MIKAAKTECFIGIEAEKERIAIRFRVKEFEKSDEDVKDPKVREKYGKKAGIAGIATNFVLMTAKISAGLIIGSIAMIADGVNNLTDFSSSLITLFGFKLSGKPEDKEHPFGHARFEYLAGLFISTIIMFLGFQLLMTSIDKIRHPEPIAFSHAVFAVLLFSIVIKIWQSKFYFKIGKKINSSTLKAAGTDSRNDVISTSAILAGFLIARFTGLMLDGYLGAAVAMFVIYSGIQLIRETSSPLLGEAADPELIEEIHSRINQYDGIAGIHDLIVHNYGPGRIFATVHIEVDAHGDLIKSHDLIDRIEKQISEDMKIHLVVHMDPVETEDEMTNMLKAKIKEIIKDYEGIEDIHDFRIVPGYTHHNLIFDIVVSPTCGMDESEIRNLISNKLNEEDEEHEYYLAITFDKSYV